ncbi:SDR family oxidoreductase [Chromobacterium rhizoryzae]|uniref:NAD-dependent epimerase/dehydratase family protein n=1 Tax=Chromobacterium rhizoryzae TaxID=1778675 RepID=A0AAD0WAJ3_9NEIS|nr:SDR family oxidoreductase [Chromobacterium rhizoryzae]AXT48656.1 NAD-dependent epimerase/dehydratase family protein [Chromobacterium rhizoryzae]
MHQILITGVTGFVGSALAANFLARGARVLAVSRNDPDGMRTINAVVAAAQGSGLDIHGVLANHLDVVNVDFSYLEDVLDDAKLAGVTEVWHVAAEMSYSPRKLSQSFATNVGNTSRLYELLSRNAPDCRRFYYVSTAYVVGMEGGLVKEELHACSHMINTYQTTKWSAEHSLHLLFHRHGLPVTLFRPSIVVGHSRSGWALRNGFGFYMFPCSMVAAAQAGLKELAVDLVADSHLDCIAIDQLAADACALTLREQQGRDFEVFHCAGGNGARLEELVHMWGEVAGLRAVLGTPTSALELKFNRAVEPNRPFANQIWQFDRSLLDAATERSTPLSPLSLEALRTMCLWYADDVAAEQAAMAEVN